MELGTLFVKLSANTESFTKGLSEASKKAEDFSKVAKKISGDLGQVGVAATAFGGAMLALAATIDGNAKKSLDGLKQSTTLVAVQVADVLTPAIAALTGIMTSVADVIASMSPELRNQVAHFAEIAAIVGVAGLAFQKLATAGEVLFSLMKSGFALMSPGILAFVVALASILAVVAVIIDNWGTFSGAFNTAVKFMSGLWDDFVSGMKTMWDWVIGAIAGGLDALGFDSVAAKMKAALNSDSLAGTLKGIASSVASVAGGALSTAVDSVQRGMAKTLDFMKDKVKDFGFDFGKGKARLPSGLDVAAVGESSGASLQAMSTRANWGSRLGNTTPAALGTDMSKRQEDQAKRQEQAIQTMAQSVTSKMGELGGVINSIAQGAQAGGAWGALIAAIMEIVSRMSSFNRMLGKAMDAIQAIADFVDMTLGPIFDVIGGIIDGITAAFNWLKANTDTGANRGDKMHTGANILSTNLATAKASGNAVAIAGAQADIAAFEKMLGMSIDTILAPSLNLADAMAKAAAETNKGADAQAKLNERLSESLTNVPAGVKVALARFNATAEASVGPGAVAHEAPYSVGPVYVNAAAGKQLWDELVGIAKGEADLRMGNSASIMRALKGA